MKVYDMLPAASPRVGFFKVGAAWSDAVLLEYGPEGTMHYAHSAVKGRTGNLYTTGMKEAQIIFGDTGDLERAILHLDELEHPQLILVESSPVSEIIGADMRSICMKMQPRVQARLMDWDNVPVAGSESYGREAAFAKAAQFIRQQYGSLEAQPESVLLLGLDDSDLNGEGDIFELRRMLKDYFGLDCMNGPEGQYALSDIRRARLILTLSPEARVLAETARELWGIPWRFGIPYGVKASEELVEDVSRLLGIPPAGSWREERRVARKELANFALGLGKMDAARLYVDVRPARMEPLRRFLEEELALETAAPGKEEPALSTDGQVALLETIQPGDILLGCGILCSLYGDHHFLCMEDPMVNQRCFTHHVPYMGLRGAMHLMQKIYDLIQQNF